MWDQALSVSRKSRPVTFRARKAGGFLCRWYGKAIRKQNVMDHFDSKSRRHFFFSDLDFNVRFRARKSYRDLRNGAQTPYWGSEKGGSWMYKGRLSWWWMPPTRAATKDFFGTIWETTSWRSSAAVNSPFHGLFQFVFWLGSVSDNPSTPLERTHQNQPSCHND